jgi:hypothetical protein
VAAISRAHFFGDNEISRTAVPAISGMVFEVEKFNRQRVEKIIGDLEKSGSRRIDDANDLSAIRRFLRVTWYYTLNCFFFFDNAAAVQVSVYRPQIAAQGMVRG